MKKYLKSVLEKAHKHSINNREELISSKKCGCFYCFEVYDPRLILDDKDTMWLDESTACCVKCGIDSVIGDASGFPIEDNLFIQLMGFVWFNGYAKGHNQIEKYRELEDKLGKHIINDIDKFV